MAFSENIIKIGNISLSVAYMFALAAVFITKGTDTGLIFMLCGALFVLLMFALGWEYDTYMHKLREGRI